MSRDAYIVAGLVGGPLLALWLYVELERARDRLRDRRRRRGRAGYVDLRRRER